MNLTKKECFQDLNYIVIAGPEFEPVNFGAFRDMYYADFFIKNLQSGVPSLHFRVYNLKTKKYEKVY